MHLGVPNGRRERPRRAWGRACGRCRDDERAVADGYAQQRDAIEVAQSGVVRGTHERAGGVGEPTTRIDHRE